MSWITRRSATLVIRATVIAFDGLVVDTLPQRAQALASAITAQGVAVTTSELMPLMPGRSFAESVAEAMQQLPALRQSPLVLDVTLHDIMAMQAQQQWSDSAAHGVPLCKGIVPTLLRQVAGGMRVVLRSDSQRREVEPLLRLSELEDSIAFVRCSDDAPRVPGASTLVSSYHAISDRLHRQRIAPHEWTAVEYNQLTVAHEV